VGVAPIGSIYAGTLANWLGARGTYLISGIIGVIGTGIIMWFFYRVNKKNAFPPSNQGESK